jgi:hypothetical protein
MMKPLILQLFLFTLILLSPSDPRCNGGIIDP